MSSVEYNPAAQSVQLVADALELIPAAQSMHAASPAWNL